MSGLKRLIVAIFTVSLAGGWISMAFVSAASALGLSPLTPIEEHKVNIAVAIGKDDNQAVENLLDTPYVHAWDIFNEGSPALDKAIPDAIGHTFLTYAIQKRAIASFNTLLRRGANFNMPYSRPLASPKERTFKLPIELALEPAFSEGQNAFLEGLLRANAVNSRAMLTPFSL